MRATKYMAKGTASLVWRKLVTEVLFPEEADGDFEGEDRPEPTKRPEPQADEADEADDPDEPVSGSAGSSGSAGPAPGCCCWIT